LINLFNVILTKNFEIYIIELSKFKKFANNTELTNWVKFIMNPEVIEMSEINNNETLKKARQKVINQDYSNSKRVNFKKTGQCNLRLQDVMCAP